MGIKVVARRRSGFTHDVEIEGGHRLVLDEPAQAGGADEGPSPTRTVAAALAACTAITVEMYADRKGWDLGEVEVEVDVEYAGHSPQSFEVLLKVSGKLSDEQRDRILVIAGKCPVHKLLAGNTDVTVTDRVAPL